MEATQDGGGARLLEEEEEADGRKRSRDIRSSFAHRNAVHWTCPRRCFLPPTTTSIRSTRRIARPCREYVAVQHPHTSWCNAPSNKASRSRSSEEGGACALDVDREDTLHEDGIGDAPGCDTIQLRHEDCPRGASSPSRNRAQRRVRRASWTVNMHCGTWQRTPGNKQVGWRRLDRNVRQKSGRTQATSDVKKVTNIDEETVVICGAGIAGMASARALHMVGIPSVILERGEDDSRTEGTAIALWANAFRALDALGIGDELRAEYPNLERFKLCNQSGRVLKEFELDECDGGPHEFRGVRRSKLLQSLQKDLPKGMIHFSCPVKSAASTENGALVVLENGQSVPCRAVLGCDGVRSNVARSLGLPPAQYAGYQAYRGVAKFDGGIPFERAVYQVWHTEGASGTRFGMYPMNSEEVYWFVCFNWPDETSQMSPKEKKADALGFVSDWGFGIADVVRNTPEDNIIRSKIGDRLLLPPFQKQWGRGYISLAGDAAHPMTPNLGQGGCCALEDAVVLGRMLSRSLPGPTTMEALRVYEKERMGRAAYLTLRSRVFGALLQLPLRPVTMTRDLIVSTAFKPDHFLDHTMYDCGILSKN